MNYNVKELLILPAEEKIVLADLLYSSVNDELKENNKEEWWKDDHFVDQLNKEYKEWKLGKTKGYTIDEVKEFMRKHKANRSSNDL